MKRTNGMMYPKGRSTKTKKYICAMCGAELTESKAYFRVDDCNAAINNNAKAHCRECYKKRYGRKGDRKEMGKYYTYAKDGNEFVLTAAGYERTLEHIKPERAVGKPIKHFETKVPTSWIEKGWVEEKAVI